VHEEFPDRRQFPQSLSDGHAHDGKHKTDRQDPQHIDPVPADPDLGHDASLRRQPVVQEKPVVGGSEVRLDGIVWERNGLSFSHTSHFFG